MWWRIAATNDSRMAELLAGAYGNGEGGLRKNDGLSRCLIVDDGRLLSVRVSECFAKYGE
jgi:hypothetical protein